MTGLGAEGSTSTPDEEEEDEEGRDGAAEDDLGGEGRADASILVKRGFFSGFEDFLEVPSALLLLVPACWVAGTLGVVVGVGPTGSSSLSLVRSMTSGSAGAGACANGPIEALLPVGALKVAP